MHDPFPLPPLPLLSRLTQPLSTYLNLTTLPLHIHEILLTSLTYHLIRIYLSPSLSRYLFPRIYPSLNARTKLNWDVHVVSLVQSIFINGLALWVMWSDGERGEMGWEERVWGYTGAGGLVQACAAGYFVWDLAVCVGHMDVFGWGLLLHAVAALVVFSFGFRPFVNFYGPTFILYELSSPFLNFHWFFDKLHMTGSKPQWYNGILLLFSFFCCRLLWGTYQSIRVYQDVWAGLHYDPSARSCLEAEMMFEPLGEADEVMRFAGPMIVPSWLAGVYLGSNVVLNTLNFYWFGKMIETVKGRFKDGKGKKGGKEKVEGVMVEGLADSSSIIDAVLDGDAVLVGGEAGEEVRAKVETRGGEKTVVEVQKTEIRKRKG